MSFALLLALAQAGGMSAWDTGKPGAPKAEWTAVARDQTLAAFKGDAVVSNGRVQLAVRRDGSAELASADGAPRARILLQGATKLEKAALVENGRGGAVLEVSCAAAKGGSLSAKLRLKRGEVAVEIEPGPGATGARLEAPSRFLVLPDFFADDIVVDAGRIPLARTEIPSENFVLHLLPGGGTIVMAAFENRDQDVQVTLAGDGEARLLTGSEILFGKEKKNRLWVALIEGPRVWTSRDVKAEEGGKILPLDWTQPFPAQWRCDFTRTDELAHSFDMIFQEKEGGPFQKPGWVNGGLEKVGPDRKYWTGSFMYSIVYPCWVDAQGKGHLQPLKGRVTHRGPAVVYPVNRIPGTPTDVFTVVDVVRASLGQGPCEYILDVEGQKSERKGRATCSVRDELANIYKAGEQKTRRKDIEGFLQQGIDFVKHIRGRIEQYLELQRGLKDYLAAEKKAKPELAASIAQLEKILAEIDGQLEDRKEKMKTPEHVVRMTDDFRKNVLDSTAPDAAEKAKQYGDALADIGGNQDDLVARCRWIVKTLRAKASMMMTQDPRMAPVAEEIRKRTQPALRTPAIHEGR
jgi:hypothetical protein